MTLKLHHTEDMIKKKILLPGMKQFPQENTW